MPALKFLRKRRFLQGGAALWAAVIVAAMGRQIGSTATPVSRPTNSVTTGASAAAQTSESCRECHGEIYEAWAQTDHALANRPVDPARDAVALKLFAAAAPGAVRPEMMLGNKPLWQPLVPTGKAAGSPPISPTIPRKKSGSTSSVRSSARPASGATGRAAA
jgi:hypothetical protein